jgi:hypothetical protein
MTNAQKNSPMLKAAGLWAKTSVKGGQYLTGRLGGVKVLILENRDRHSDDDPSHILYFTEAPDRRQDAGERPQESSDEQRGAGTPRTPQTPSAAHRSGVPGHRSGVPGHRDQGPDHQAPLGRDGPAPVRDVLDDVPEWAR